METTPPADSRDTRPARASALLRAGTWLRLRRLHAAGVITVLLFALVVARFWDPYYGFTRFLQFSAAHAEGAIAPMREQAVFTYPLHGPYDGMLYAQLAFHPLLDTPELARALDNPGFRARRILLSATAWLAAGGRETHIAHTYAALNVVAWFAFAVLLWRLLPVRDGWGWLAWAGLLFSAGALHSVRRSLTDLPASLLIAGGMLLLERGGLRRGLGLLAAAALTRETGVLAAAGPAPARWGSPGGLKHLILVAAAIATPLAAWLLYVRHQFGPGNPGFSNFSWPLHGWLVKWWETVAAFEHPSFRWLVTTTLLAAVGMTAQAVFFLVHWRPRDSWWRLGAVHLALGLFLGHAVWEDHPGAYTRVLLPMSLAFAVCAVRWRVRPAWIVAGSLTVFAGVEALQTVEHRPEQLTTGRAAGHGYVVQLTSGFFPREGSRGGVRAWSSGDASLEVRFAQPVSTPRLRVSFSVRGFTPRTLRLRDAEGELWTGSVGESWQRIEVTIRPAAQDGRWIVYLDSPEAPHLEADVPGARTLAFAVRQVRVSEPPPQP